MRVYLGSSLHESDMLEEFGVHIVGLRSQDALLGTQFSSFGTR